LVGGASAGARVGGEVTLIPSVAGSQGSPDGGGLILMLMGWALTWRGCLTGLVCTLPREQPTTLPIEGIRRGKL